MSCTSTASSPPACRTRSGAVFWKVSGWRGRRGRLLGRSPGTAPGRGRRPGTPGWKASSRNAWLPGTSRGCGRSRGSRSRSIILPMSSSAGGCPAVVGWPACPAPSLSASATAGGCTTRAASAPAGTSPNAPASPISCTSRRSAPAPSPRSRRWPGPGGCSPPRRRSPLHHPHPRRAAPPPLMAPATTRPRPRRPHLKAAFGTTVQPVQAPGSALVSPVSGAHTSQGAMPGSASALTAASRSMNARDV